MNVALAANSFIYVIQFIELMLDLKEKILINIHKGIETNMLSNDDVVQIIEHCGEYLNLCTITKYAKDFSMSYNGVKKFRKIVTLFGVKFVIENE